MTITLPVDGHYSAGWPETCHWGSKQAFMLLLLLLLLALPAAAQDLAPLLTDQDAFCAREIHSGRHWEVHPELCERPELPASTFKIPNTLIALESGVIENPGTVLKWDGKKREIESWNRDHSLKSAFENSVVWYYQEVARRVGLARMQQFLDEFDYGNRNPGGGVDHFWLDGELRISPLQQLEFLEKVSQKQLPLKERTYQMAFPMMTVESKEGQTMYAKTGWARPPGANIGWYVGWVDRPNETLVFAYNCRRGAVAPQNFAEERIRVTRACLQRLGW